MLNETYFSQAQYNTPSWRRSVMCQEIGHTFGLDHQDVNTSNANLGSCMDYTRDPSGTKGTNGSLSNERPNKHDFDQLTSIYTHLDASQLASTKPSQSGSTMSVRPGPTELGLSRHIGRTSAEWGRPVRSDARGRPRLFVRNLGGGLEVADLRPVDRGSRAGARRAERLAPRGQCTSRLWVSALVARLKRGSGLFAANSLAAA